MNRKLSIIGLSMVLLFSCKKNEISTMVSSQTEAVPDAASLSSTHACSSGMHGPKKSDISTSGVGVTADFWPNNPNGPLVLRVKFLDHLASDYVRGKIQTYAKEWEQYANVRFDFVDSNQPADIRITNVSGDGSWSYPGRENLNVPSDQATMNYGWFDDSTSDEEFSRVVVHEFGHALGLGHEQCHPQISIRWNKPYVYAYYQRTNGWSKTMVDQNVFYRFPKADATFSPYDPTSIMHYPVPKEFTLNGVSVGWNTKLSEGDKGFIQKMYPFSTSGDIPDEGEQLCTITGFTSYLYNTLATNKLEVRLSATNDIILSEAYPGYPLDTDQKNDQYMIIDASGKQYDFNSQTRFSAKTSTGLKGRDIRILKNGQQILND